MRSLVICNCTRTLGGWVRQSVFSISFHLGKIPLLPPELSKLVAWTWMYQREVQDEDFLRYLAFWTGMTVHLKLLNLRLWGRQQNVSQLVGQIEVFRKELHLLGMCLKKNDLTIFSPTVNCWQTKYGRFSNPRRKIRKFQLSVKKDLRTLKD